MIYSDPERNATEKEGRYIQNWDLHGTRDLGQAVFCRIAKSRYRAGSDRRFIDCILCHHC